MTQDIGILSQLIKSSALTPIETRNNKNRVRLQEPQEPDSFADINGIPDNAIIIRGDAFRSPDTIFTGIRGECKRADFIIVADDNGKKRILIIEMKKATIDKQEIVKQMKGSLCFMKYCEKIGQEFWGKRDFLKGFHYRYIALLHVSINKRRTRIERHPKQFDTPATMMKIACHHHLEFNLLAGR